MKQVLFEISGNKLVIKFNGNFPLHNILLFQGKIWYTIVIIIIITIIIIMIAIIIFILIVIKIIIQIIIMIMTIFTI